MIGEPQSPRNAGPARRFAAARRTVGVRPSGMRRVGDAHAADAGKLQRRTVPVEAERQPEQVELDAFLPPDQHPGEAEERDLDPGAAGREPDRGAAGQEVLADGRRREIETQLGNGAGDEGREGVAVRSRPRAVARGVGVRRARPPRRGRSGRPPRRRACRPGGRAGCRTSSCRGPSGSRARADAPRSTPQPMTSYRANGWRRTASPRSRCGRRGRPSTRRCARRRPG